jgi:DNA repair exonuclease SbcCD nuclease subunit
VNRTDKIRILFLADSHLGYDMAQRPRINRKRRGQEFFDNFDQALLPALEGKTDVVVHGGDLFYRSRIPQWLALSAIERIRRVTNRGIPVLIVPGNHERSSLPYPLLWNLPNLHVFEDPRTVVLDIRGVRLALSGFPYNRGNLREELSRVISHTAWQDIQSDIRLLCLHQIVQGARVGVSNFTFTQGPHVIPRNALPTQFAGVLTGHVHRFQVLGEREDGTQSQCRVFYPGSTARTSFAECNEQKGYLLIDVVPTDCGKGAVNAWGFQPLPSRPMETVGLSVSGLTPHRLKQKIEQRLATLDPESIVRLKISGIPENGIRSVLTAQSLRSIAPTTMNIDLRWTQTNTLGQCSE